MPIDPFTRAMADSPAAFAVVLDWWRGGSRGEPPHLTFRAEEFGLRGVHKKPRPMVWPKDLDGGFLVTASASAGIDSTAAVLLAREQWPHAPMLLVRADTGFEPEDSEAILHALARKVGAATVTLLAYEDLYDMIRAYGRIPNKASSPWCSTGLKGGRLDKFFEWLVDKRKLRTTVHVTGLLACEPGRVEKHLALQRQRFGDKMQEVGILLDKGIDKRAAYHLSIKHKIPISDTYEVRRRHGCIPCKWWSYEAQWRDFYRADPAGFFAAADLEEEIERVGKTSERGPNPIGQVAKKQYRVWLLGRARAYPKGLQLREWLSVWDAETPGWRKAPLEFEGIVAKPGAEPGWTPSELIQLGGGTPKGRGSVRVAKTQVTGKGPYGKTVLSLRRLPAVWGSTDDDGFYAEELYLSGKVTNLEAPEEWAESARTDRKGNQLGYRWPDGPTPLGINVEPEWEEGDTHPTAIRIHIEAACERRLRARGTWEPCWERVAKMDVGEYEDFSGTGQLDRRFVVNGVEVEDFAQGRGVGGALYALAAALVAGFGGGLVPAWTVEGHTSKDARRTWQGLGRDIGPSAELVIDQARLKRGRGWRRR